MIMLIEVNILENILENSSILMILMMQATHLYLVSRNFNLIYIKPGFCDYWVDRPISPLSSGVESLVLVTTSQIFVWP